MGKTTDNLLELIRKNPTITRETLANALQMSVRGIEYQLRKLKEDGIIDRKGGRKDGYWNVIKK